MATDIVRTLASPPLPRAAGNLNSRTPPVTDEPAQDSPLARAQAEQAERELKDAKARKKKREG